MSIDEIYESITSGEITLDTLEITNLVVGAVTKEDVIDCDKLQEIITGLQGVKKTAKEEFKAFKEEINKVAKEELAIKGKAYFDTLKVGDPVSWIKTDGTVLRGTVGEQKKGNKTAHVILDDVPDNGKPDRHVKYHFIIVPEDFDMMEKETA